MFQHCFAIYRDVQLSGCYHKVNNVTYIVTLWYMLTLTLKVLLQKFFLSSFMCLLFVCCFIQEVIKLEDI